LRPEPAFRYDGAERKEVMCSVGFADALHHLVRSRPLETGHRAGGALERSIECRSFGTGIRAPAADAKRNCAKR
jgi:hypothetical protein